MKLHLLEGRHIGGYTTFGTYWTRGKTKGDNFLLTAEDGRSLPMQTEIVACWPDGSVKWARHTADARQMGRHVTVMPGEATQVAETIRITETDNGYRVDAGQITLTVCKPGTDLLAQNVSLDGVLRVEEIRPVFLLERRSALDDGEYTTVRRTCPRVNRVTFEAQNPLECTVRFDGYYEVREQLMPFIVRMYVGLNAPDIRFDHTFVYNGVEERDFLKGMGIQFRAALTGTKYNHHARFMTDSGIFHEPAILMESRIPRTTADMKIAQLAGENLRFASGTPEAELAEKVAVDLPIWNRYVLTQLNADSYQLQKRTKPGRCCLTCRQGRRTDGLMAVSGEDGGILLAQRDFWQRHPAGLEVEGLSSMAAECTVWFHSPEAPAYDFRHYDDRSYPYSSYEGFKRYGASADGIATTSQCSLLLSNAWLSNEALTEFSQSVQKPAVYVATPEEYHAKRAFGYWSLPCMDNESECAIEETLAKAIQWYQGQVEQRRWYGLFDYGDFMHSYDPQRHTWKYDIGGCAWQNTELVPTYWLWLYFLRTGREDVFSMAEAMSRHTSETDIYHHGPMKGIGSRHNVRHWGCSCKEPRVSMAGHHRPMFYLTGDRRLGDVFDEVQSASSSQENAYFTYAKDSKLPAVRTGPDWAAYVSNWMTAHERTLNEKPLQYILTGLEDIHHAPLRLGSGPAFAFDAKTGHMHYIGESFVNIHLTLCMGGPQVWMETADALDSNLLRDMLAEYGRFYLMTDAERATSYGEEAGRKPCGMNYVAAAIAAYGAVRLGDDELARRAWEVLLSASPRRYKKETFEGDVYATTDDGLPLDELAWVTTNYVSQWCLNAIITLDFIRDALPDLAEADCLAAIPMSVGK